jgi:hypothetical protein
MIGALCKKSCDGKIDSVSVHRTIGTTVCGCADCGYAKISEPIVYTIVMPHSFAGIHDIFHVSQLWKCVYDPSHVMSLLIFNQN